MSRPAVDFPTTVCFSASAVNGANGRFGSEAVVWQIDRALFLPIERLVLLPQLARELAQQGSDSAFPWIARN